MLSENSRFAVIDVVAGDERYDVMAQNPRHAWVEVPDRSDRMTGHPLRVLIANEREDRIELVTTLVAGLGHDVIAGSTNVARGRSADRRASIPMSRWSVSATARRTRSS